MNTSDINPSANGFFTNGNSISKSSANGALANEPSVNKSSANGALANEPSVNKPSANGVLANEPSVNKPSANRTTANRTSPKNPHKTVDGKESVRKGIIYFFLSVWAVMVLFPFYWMLLTSVKSYGSYNAEYIPKFYTLTPTLQNYIDAFTAVPLAKYFTNTIIFTLLTTGIMLVVIVPAAFAFSRMEFRGKNLVFTAFLSLMMIPNELVIITNFQTITNAGLRNSFTGLILPSVTSVFYIYLLKENFEQIPDSLYKAAKVDGTSDFRYLTRVMIPICKPTLITITILKVIECWNSYVWPRLITDDAAYYLVSNGIQEIRENGFGRENIPAMMAAVVVISVPLIILFLIFHKKIMEGVSRGGTKG